MTMLTFDEARRRWAVVLKEDPTMTVSILKQRAIFGDVCQRGLRSVCWKIYLGYLETLDPSNWMLPLEKERQHYEQLRKKHIIDPNTTNEDTNETGVRQIVEHHPLSLDETSPWSQFFQDTELRRIIKQDVERTFPDNLYFRKPITQERMTDILFVYCKIHSAVSYRQGMHELLAPILMVIDNDALDPEECIDDNDPDMAKYMSITLNREFVEHDAFVLFSSVMATAKQWYEFTEEPRRPAVNRAALVSPRSAKFEQLNEMANSSTPILRISHRIHHELLKTIDNDLYEHLEQLAIEPQIYAIRWLRLLFGREFPLADVYCLWDALFADDRSLGAVEYVCVSMLLFIREELLSKDYSGCLHQLMRYPTVSDITIFVKQAVHLRQNPTKEAGYEIRHRNAVREGKEEEWKEREAQRERLRQQDLEKQQVQDPRQQIKREVSNVVGKIRDRVTTVASNVVGGVSPPRLSSDSYNSPVTSHSSSHSDSNVRSIMFTSGQRRRHSSLNSTNPPQRKSSHSSLTPTVSLAQPKMGRILARSIVIIERELYGNNRVMKQTVDEPKEIEEKEMQPPVKLTDGENIETNSNTVEAVDSIKSTDNEETNGYRVPGADNITHEAQDPQVQLIIALAGLKHVRDVLCGTAPEFDSTVLDNLEDDWVDLNDEKEAIKSEPLAMEHEQSGNAQESVDEDGGNATSLTSSPMKSKVNSLVEALAETSTDSKSHSNNISQRSMDNKETVSNNSKTTKSATETTKKNSATTTEKRSSKSASHTLSPQRSPRTFSLEEIIAEASVLPTEQDIPSILESALSNDTMICSTSTNKVDPLSSNKAIPPVQKQIKRKPVRTAASLVKTSTPSKTATLGEQISIDPLGALSEDSSSITSSVVRKNPSVRSICSTKSTTSTQGKRLTADQLAKITDLDDSTGSVKDNVKTESKTVSVTTATTTKTATTVTAVKSTTTTTSSTSSIKKPKVGQPPVALPQEAVDPLNTTQVSRKPIKPKMDPKLAKVIKRTPKYRSTEAIMKEMARWEKNDQGVSSDEEEDNAPLAYTMGIDTRHIDPSRIGRPLEGVENNSASPSSSFGVSSAMGGSEWNEDIHRGVKMVGPPLPPADLAPEVSAGEWANHTPEPEVTKTHIPTMDIPDFAADVLGWSAADEEDREEETHTTSVDHHHTNEIISSIPEDEYVFASKASTASLHSITSISTTISPTVEAFSSIHHHHDQDGFSILNTVGGNTAPWSPTDLDRPSMFSAEKEEEEHNDNETNTQPTTSYHATNNMEDEWNPWS